MPQQQQAVTYGPLVEVTGGEVVGVRVGVQRSYGGVMKPPTIWRGMVTLFLARRPFIDAEVSLVQGREGRFINWPSRSYDSGGQTKYKNMIWVHDREVSAATVAAIEQYMATQAQGVFRGDFPDDRPF